MKVGFKINLKNYEVLMVESSEFDDGYKCLKELLDFLKQFDHVQIKRFIKSFYGTRIRPEKKPEKKEEEK